MGFKCQNRILKFLSILSLAILVDSYFPRRQVAHRRGNIYQHHGKQKQLSLRSFRSKPDYGSLGIGTGQNENAYPIAKRLMKAKKVDRKGKEQSTKFFSAVKIEEAGGKGFICGGTLLYENLVITSAECLIHRYSSDQWVSDKGLAAYENGSFFQVSVGEVTFSSYDEQKTKKIHKGKSVTHSTGWNWVNSGYNIGGLYLEKNVTVEKGIVELAKVCGGKKYDPKYGEEIKGGTTFYVTGWVDPAKYSDYRETLSYFKAKLVSDAECHKELAKNDFNPPKMNKTTVCLQATDPASARACYTDFGSGVFLASPGGGCLWGVVNQGVACPDNKYTVVTRIEPFKEFIGAMPHKYGNCNLTDLECWGYIKNQTPHSDLYEEETTAAAVFVWDAMDLDTFAACLFLSIVFIRWH